MSSSENRLKISLSLAQLFEKIDCINQLDIKNTDPNFLITSLKSLKNAKKQDLAFCSDKKYLKELYSTKAKIVLISLEIADLCQFNKTALKNCWLICKNPRLDFGNLCDFFYPQKPPKIYPSAVIAKTAKIGKNAAISAGVVIGENVQIGDDVLIYPNSVIYDNVKIGNRVVIQAGTVIGCDGYGFDLVDGKAHKQPQIGSVIVGDDVEIGANCTVDCGTIGDTIIENQVKIDNLVHIAHNVKIGFQTAIMGNSGIAGGTEIGKGCRIYGMVAINGQISIADGVRIHGHSTVTKSIKKANSSWASTSILQTLSDWGKNSIAATKLSEMRISIRRLEGIKKQ